jgi:class 3 adenylate cyclase/tetratricopeptide (TPR) repeat protein
VGLVCASCGADNSSSARFCSECGAPLQRTCPACGFEQPAGATFCSNCGIALRDDARRAAGAAEERQERRVVTVLFADLAGSTALGERLDPEDVRELQGELFELINTEVERFGGTTEKFAGDAVLAVFGIPQAHEDDPERAVRAALAARESFVSFTERVHGRHGADVGLRIGVNTGEVVAGREAAARGELMVSGDAVNVAARLQQHAEPGEVLVGQRTQAATSRTISYREHEPLEAKGKSAPVAAWVAVAAGEQEPRGIAGLSAPLVGRDEELAILSAVAARAERERAPQLVTLFGPAGVGKSRLLAELVERLPARLIKGRCLPYGEGITFWPLAEAAKAHAGILDTDPAEVALSKLRAAIESVVPEDQAERVLEAATWTIGFALPGASAAGTDPHEVLRRLQDGWTRYVAALGREQLTVVAVEDVHWASSALLDLVEQLAENLADTKVLLLCTARIELLELRPTWGAGKQNATALSLAPLSPADAAHLLSSLLGEVQVPDDVRERVLASAEGNPFYLEEMLNMLIEEGALERQNGGWASTDRLADVSIPDSVHGVIAARIDLLEAASRDALRRCSVVGRSFWPAAVDVDEKVIGGLVRSGLVSDSVDSSMAGMREFAFKHALTRDVVYATLPRPERRELHRRVGEWIQHIAPDRSAETVELAAYHYGQAVAYGEDDPAVSSRAYELLMAASEAAYGRGAFDTARMQTERALELAVDESRLAAAELGLARLDTTEGLNESALGRLDTVESLLAPSDAELRSDALGLRSRVCWFSGRWDEALSSANAAVAALAGLPESPQLARALARQSQVEMLKQRPESVDHAREAIAVARRVGDSFAELNATINLFTQESTQGTAPNPDDFAAIVDSAAEAGEYEEGYRAIINFIWSASGYLPLDRVELVVTEGRRRLADVPPPGSIGPYLDVSATMWLLVPSARWTEADAVLPESGGRELAMSTRLAFLTVAGGLAFRRGEAQASKQLLEELRPLALASGELQRIVPMASVVLPWLARNGEVDELRSLTNEILAAVDQGWPAVLDAVPVVRGLAAAGEMELLAQTTESLRETPHLAANSQTALMAAEGLLALLEGRADEAAEQLELASERESKLGRMYPAACLELDLARALEAAGHTAASNEVRARAAAVLEPLGCVNPF